MVLPVWGDHLDADRLERLALIDRLPGKRVRPLVDRSIVWRKSLMRGLDTRERKEFARQAG